MSSSVWQWEAIDSTGVCRGGGPVDPHQVWWATTAEEVANYGMAGLVWQTGMRFDRLTGWVVRAWRDGVEPVTVRAEEWLRTVQPEPPHDRLPVRARTPVPL